LPGTVKGLAGTGNGDVDIFLGGFVDGHNGLLGGRVDRLECFAVYAFDEFVVDEAVASTVSVRFVVGSVRPRLVRPQCGVAQNDSDAKVAGSNAQNDLKGRVR